MDYDSQGKVKCTDLNLVSLKKKVNQNKVKVWACLAVYLKCTVSQIARAIVGSYNK